MQAAAFTGEATAGVESTAPESGTRWLRLRCHGQTYALELLKVQEVVRPAPLLSLRGTPAAMLGIMNLRGQVVPVFDFAVYLNNAPIQSEASTRIVVIEENGELLGLLVSAVDDVATLDPGQIEPPGNAHPGCGDHGIFCGIARAGNDALILLDVSALLRAM